MAKDSLDGLVVLDERDHPSTMLGVALSCVEGPGETARRSSGMRARRTQSSVAATPRAGNVVAGSCAGTSRSGRAKGFKITAPTEP
jgi:hypothetical protein